MQVDYLHKDEVEECIMFCLSVCPLPLNDTYALLVYDRQRLDYNLQIAQYEYHSTI